MKYDIDLDLETRNSLSLIVSRIKPNSIVLEFGPANGRMTKYLKEELDCKVYAVEMDKDSAEDAGEYCEQILVADAEEYTWLDRYKNIEFDYIVFADVLEHLYYPEKVLKNSISLLKDNASILLSVPNIAHNAIIIELLNDKFTYRDVGLLDNTHIRFFTKNTLDKLIKDCDLEIQYETGSYANPANTEFQYNYTDIEENISHVLINRKYGEIYQFILEAKKKVTAQIIDFTAEDSATLYYDTGSGFNENEKISSVFSTEKHKKIEFTFENISDNIKAIRIDPLEHPLTIKIKSLKIGGTDFSQYLTHNGTEIGNGQVSFLHYDPQFIFVSDERMAIKNISLEYEFLTKIHNLKDQQIQKKDQQIQEKDQQIQEKDQQIQERTKELLSANNAINDKEVHIQNQNITIQHWHDVAQSLRIKNRTKRVIKKIMPNKLWKILKYIKHNPSSIKLGLHIVKTQGMRTLLKKISKVDNLPEYRIENSYQYIQPILTKNIEKKLKLFNKKPLISIIMPVYNVEPKWLDLAIKSIENQWYDNWELCITDDKSTNKETLEYLKSLKNNKIKIIFLKENVNISAASNEALKLASGDYVALMDNDDELTPDALFEVVKVIENNDSEFIYSDEDKLEMDGSHSDPHFKPDFAPDMFLSQNYMSHLGIIKKELIDKVGGFTVGLEGAQDYDLYLKILEHTNKVHHISKVLYHWRKIPGSTAADFDDKSYAQEAGIKSLENALNRRNIDAKVLNGKYPGTYRVKYKLVNNPLVSIIIPFKDKPELLTMCIESILEKTTYKNFEVIGISNNSEEKITFDEMDRLESLDNRIKFYEYNVPFNYSDINNHAVETYAKGEQILLLNNDIEIITADWIEALLEFSQRENIGVVGAKLYYPNDTIQHAGVIIGIGGVAGHSHKYFPMNYPGYFSRLNIIQNLSTLTAACLMVKKKIYFEADGLNQEELKIAFNDVDFCLRAREQGYLNIFTPYCEAYHHESISRGHEDTEEKQERFSKEVKYMQNRHSDILENGDPYYNKNLTLDREDFSLR